MYYLRDNMHIHQLTRQTNAYVQYQVIFHVLYISIRYVYLPYYDTFMSCFEYYYALLCTTYLLIYAIRYNINTDRYFTLSNMSVS